MSEFLSFLETIKDLGSTVLLVGAALWFGFRYFPNQMRLQGEMTEAIRHNTAVMEECTETLKMANSRDEATKATLERIEKHIESLNRNALRREKTKPKEVTYK